MADKDLGGRPSLLDDKVRNRILECIEIGMPYKYAGNAARVNERTMYIWLEKGADDVAAERDTEYSRFIQDIEAAVAGRLEKHMNRINGGDKVWHSSAWMLERRWRKDFGQDAQVINELEERLQKLESTLQKQDDNPLNKPVNSENEC